MRRKESQNANVTHTLANNMAPSEARERERKMRAWQARCVNRAIAIYKKRTR